MGEGLSGIEGVLEEKGRLLKDGECGIEILYSYVDVEFWEYGRFFVRYKYFSVLRLVYGRF